MEKITFDYFRLKYRIFEVCGTQTEFAQRMNRNRSVINLKLNNQSEFTQSDIQDACVVLNIPREEIGSYFFTLKNGISQE